MGLCETCGIEPGCQRVWKNTSAKVVNCVSWTPAPPTNADHIREMTDEELADFLQNIAMFGGIDGLKKIMTWSEWIKEPYTE